MTAWKKLKEVHLLEQKNVIWFCFWIMLISSSCDSPQPKWDSIVADALHQAIALEKLPEIAPVLSQSDTIWIYPVKKLRKSSEFDSSLALSIPLHSDTWKIQTLDKHSIKFRAKDNEFEYLLLQASFDNGECRVDIIKEIEFPPGVDLIQIDRGRLTVFFKCKNGFWTIKNILSWYG